MLNARNFFILLTCVSVGCSSASSLKPVYEGGYPTAETAQAAFDEYDYACE